jgi:Predicted membrane protein
VSQADPGGAKALAPLQTPPSGLPTTTRLEPGLVRASVLTCGLMVLYGLAWESFIDPVREGSWLWLKVIPLAVAMPGLARARVYTYQWMSLLIWLYLCEALVRIASPSVSERWLALGWLALGLVLCGAILLAIQRLKRQQKKLATNPSSANDGLHNPRGDDPQKK